MRSAGRAVDRLRPERSRRADRRQLQSKLSGIRDVEFRGSSGASLRDGTCGAMNGLPDARIRSATADVTGHRLVDVFVGGLRLLSQKHGSTHELARLTVATLRYIFLDPGTLQRVAQIRR